MGDGSRRVGGGGVAVLASRSTAAQPRQPARSQHGRLFPPQDLGLLEAPDRDEWQRPQQILDALGVADASVVADVGAGSGWFTVRLARRVGPNGLVYAQDVQPEMLAAITRRVQREGLRNVRPVLGRGSDPAAAGGARSTPCWWSASCTRSTIASSCSPTWPGRSSRGDAWGSWISGRAIRGPDRRPPTGFRPPQIDAEATRAGLRLLREETFLPFQYFLIFGRGDQTATRTGAVSATGRARAPQPAARPRPPRP